MKLFLVTGWPQNWCGDGHVIGSTAGIWVESPDRVIIFSRGCLPRLEDPGDLTPTRNASGFDLSQKDPARHPRWDHVVNIVDRSGKYVTSWGMRGDGSLYTADVHVGRPQKFRPRPGADRNRLIGAPTRAVIATSTR
jgi:hypothetical protein